jgi:formimidoylglutamate deiminase
MSATMLWAPRAWVGGRWQTGVVLTVDGNGTWADIVADIGAPPSGATPLPGPALPGLVNAHSHAFQRAFAGLAERRDTEADDFWSWRDRMYGVALRITPPQMRAVTAMLAVELLRGGYTQLCDFHYLHHTEDGRAYEEPATMAWALADGAADAGIGLTLLPVLYERAGFAQPTLRVDQRRFAGTPAFIHALQRAVHAAGRPLLSTGVAIHSLRAASPAAIHELMALVGDDAIPVHIHIAEQQREVQDCLAATGARPIEWLCREARPDHRWHLVHATHGTPAEIDAVAACGAGVVICPSTEANLGDGLADLPGWLRGNVSMSIGSDSHVCRSWAEELRWLDYGQRLALQQRNVSAAPAMGQPATAARLFDAVLAGSARAAGHARWGLVAGARADLLVVDETAAGVLGVPASHILDALVFATDAPALREVYVAGRRVVAEGKHVDEAVIARRFAAVMAELWNVNPAGAGR